MVTRWVHLAPTICTLAEGEFGVAILHVRGVPDSLYEQIRRRAVSERRSIGGEVILLLEQAVAERPAEHDDPEYREFRRRADVLRRQADEWYQERRRPIDPDAYAAMLEDMMRRAEERAERFGPFPDSVAMLQAGRKRTELA
jgi:hypothetical protein